MSLKPKIIAPIDPQNPGFVIKIVETRNQVLKSGVTIGMTSVPKYIRQYNNYTTKTGTVNLTTL